MKNAIFVLCLLSMLLAAPTVFADQESDLNKRFQSCMSSTGCALQENLSLIKDMTAQSSADLQSIVEFCNELHYAGCIADQKNKISQWHLFNERMALLMRRAESSVSENHKNIAKTKEK